MNIRSMINRKIEEKEVENTNNNEVLITALQKQVSDLAINVTNTVTEAINNMSATFNANLIEKDKQIDRANKNVEMITDLIGMKSVNTKRLTKMLKTKLQIKYDKRLWKDTKEFVEGKRELFDYFGVRKWEDIPVIRYNEVEEYIKNLK